MKLKTKLYLFQAVLIVILLIFLGGNYLSYQYQYKKDMNTYINNEIELYKKIILSSIENANIGFDQKKEFFYDIHKNALAIMNKNPNMDLKDLQQNLINKFNLINTDIELYLIDKSYTIYKSTDLKDLGFNLSIVAEAKDFLDKSSTDGKIYISDFVSTDSMNMEYKLYSYAKFNENSYLELGFKDKSIKNTSMSILAQNIHSKNKIEVFSLGKNHKGYYFYDLVKNRDIKNKKDFFTSLEKIPKVKTNDYPVVNVGLTFQSILQSKDNYVIAYVPIFEKNMFNILGFENIVMKLEIDIGDKKEFLKKYQNMFILSLIVITFLLIILYIFLKRSFTNPIDTITKNLNNLQKIDNQNILSSNDELSIISNKYNILFEKLSNEIKFNSDLLKENKRFIADTVHQIRTPLTNIMMNAEMVKKFQKDDSLSSFIDKIDSSINMLSNSYEDLAYVITSDTIEYPPTNVNLSDMIKNRIKFFSTISKVNQKEIISYIEDNIFVHINQIELERIIDNNISNAIKYANKNQAININLFKDTNKVIMEFKTFGKAIKNKNKVFEKNYRENEAKRGLGLGLNMVKNICEKYNIFYEVSYENAQNIFTYTFKLKNN